MSQLELLHEEVQAGQGAHAVIPSKAAEYSAAHAENGAADKSPGAFKTISEVAAMLDLPQHVLRFWESRFRQIRPLKLRGGRRYYRPEDIEIISTIKHLLYAEGYTIKGAQKALEQARQARKHMQEPAATQAALSVLAQRSAEAMGLEKDSPVADDNAEENRIIPQRPAAPGLRRERLLHVREELLVLRSRLVELRSLRV